MKHYTLILTMLLVVSQIAMAQNTEHLSPQEVLTKMAKWDKIDQRYLDSLDMELHPLKVTGGIIAEGNFSNFIISHRGATPMGSYMRAGFDLGGFLDFSIIKNLGIQGQLLMTFENNQYAIGTKNNNLWSYGIEVPIYLMARFGNMHKGYLQFGAGPYTHFTYANNRGTYTENYSVEPSEIDKLRAELESTYSDIMLHNTHFGLGVTVGYEFPIGIQLNASYKVSLSDIASFRQKYAEGSNIYPQRISFGIAYRWKRITPAKDREHEYYFLR